MPQLDEEFEDLDPSTSSDLDDKATNAENASVADAAVSSPATGEEDNDLLAVVRDVVKERKSDTASPAEGEEVSGQAQDDGQPKKLDDENFSDVPFHKHPRFQHLLRERNGFKQDATRYQNVERFLDDANLSAEEAFDGLTIMGLAKTDPAKAWQEIRPWVEKLLHAAGEVIPDDLRQRVEKGELTPDAALEVSRSRATTASVHAAQSFREQREQRRQQTDAVNALRDTAISWQNDRMTKDPNFATKQPLIMKEVLYLQQTEGKPNTREGVQEQLNKAYKLVNANLKPATATPRPTVRPTSGQVAGNPRPAPGGGGKEPSTLDIIRANRRTG